MHIGIKYICICNKLKPALECLFYTMIIAYYSTNPDNPKPVLDSPKPEKDEAYKRSSV